MMDYSGLDYRNIRYPVNRPLTKGEYDSRFLQKEEKKSLAMDFFSVIKFNSEYIELVDRWYRIKGFNAWLGMCILAISVFLASIIIWAFFFVPTTDQRAALWFMLIAFMPLSLFLIWCGWFVIKTECWRWTHYPMRLNRKTRQVHVFRQNGTVLAVSWEDLFIVRGESRSPMSGTTYDLRAHVLEPDGITVKESFSLGYASPLGNAQSIDKFWAFLQPYMEAQDGVERTYKHLKKAGYLVPVDGRKEGWRWSIALSFMLAAHWPWLQFLGAPFLGLNAIGRMFAMWTSKQPRWPREVEDAGKPDAGDPYALTWRDNASLGWWELGWPLLCTVLGIGVFIGAIGCIFIYK